jgi:hypothetical protein
MDDICADDLLMLLGGLYAMGVVAAGAGVGGGIGESLGRGGLGTGLGLLGGFVVGFGAFGLLYWVSIAPSQRLAPHDYARLLLRQGAVGWSVMVVVGIALGAAGLPQILVALTTAGVAMIPFMLWVGAGVQAYDTQAKAKDPVQVSECRWVLKVLGVTLLAVLVLPVVVIGWERVFSG